MSSNESAAYEIMTELDVDYVLGKIYIICIDRFIDTTDI